jgi:hypothetical protein
MACAWVHLDPTPPGLAGASRLLNVGKPPNLQRGWPLVGSVYPYLRYISVHFHRNGVRFGSDTNAGIKSASTKGVALFGKRW